MTQRILVTGAARGIGAETARRLAARGHRLALLGLEPAELRAVAAACGPGTPAIEVDVTNRDALYAAVDRAVGELGGLDAVIANAGIASAGIFRSMDEDAWERVIDVNVKGAYRTVKAAVPHLVASRGYLLLVASVAAVVHAPMLSAYSASKAAVEAFADVIRPELAPHGVDVGCAYFSWIDTEMVRGIGPDSAYQQLRGALKPPFDRTYPVDRAAGAVVRGVERRAHRVVTPRWIRPLLPVRGVLQPIADAQVRRGLPEVERRWDEEVAARGAEASAPVGAGGAADSRERALT